MIPVACKNWRGNKNWRTCFKCFLPKVSDFLGVWIDFDVVTCKHDYEKSMGKTDTNFDGQNS